MSFRLFVLTDFKSSRCRLQAAFACQQAFIFPDTTDSAYNVASSLKDLGVKMPIAVARLRLGCFGLGDDIIGQGFVGKSGFHRVVIVGVDFYVDGISV